MGNCCIKGSSSTVWAGDDWDSMGRSGPGPDNDKERLLGGGVVAGAEMRIKISKKELQELLIQRRGKKGLVAAENVLEMLIERSLRVEARRGHHRCWRPELPTIPELD